MIISKEVFNQLTLVHKDYLKNEFGINFHE